MTDHPGDYQPPFQQRLKEELMTAIPTPACDFIHDYCGHVHPPEVDCPAPEHCPTPEDFFDDEDKPAVPRRARPRIVLNTPWWHPR